MVRGPYVLDGEHYIALEDPALVLESRIRIYATPWLHFTDFDNGAATSFHMPRECCVRVASSEAQHPGRARLSRQMRLNFVDDKSRP